MMHTSEPYKFWVKITQCSNENAWYKDSIDKHYCCYSFQMKDEDDLDHYVVYDKAIRWYRTILKSDCVQVDTTRITL